MGTGKLHASRLLVLALIVLSCGSIFGGNVSVADVATSPTMGIQEAIDAVADGGGGEVFVPAGRYVLSQSVFLTGNLTLRGAGNQTILEVVTEVASALTEDGIVGQTSVKVAEPSRFRPGDPVIISGSGRKAPRSNVKAIEAGALILTDALTAACEVERGAQAIRTFSALRTRGRVANLTIRDMRIVGSLRNSYQGFSTWRDNSLISLEGVNIQLINIEAVDAAGDAICVNGSGMYTIRDCRIENSRLRGIHIGNDPADVIISGNIIRQSGLYGIYLCNGCRRTNISDNSISKVGYFTTDHGDVETPFENPRDLYIINTRISGIGGLGGGGLQDRFDNISNNVIQNSRGSGISFLRWSGEVRPGKHINLTGNNIQDVDYSAIYLYAAEGINVQGNLVAGGGVGITVAKSQYCNIRNNLVQNCAIGVDVFSDEDALQSRYNIVAGNSLVECGEALRLGKRASRNRLEHNYIMGPAN